MTRDQALALDASDPLSPLREHFALPPGVVYLDGNSLGALPKATPARVAKAVAQEWGVGLIESWNTAGWIDLPRRLGDRLAPWIGAGTGEVLVTDTTSINLYKVLHAALRLRPDRTRIVGERGNFPTDDYIAQSVVQAHGGELVLADRPEDIPALLDERCAVLMLTHVNYRSGRMHDMDELTRRSHAAGALALWDLCHSAGAVPVDLTASDADFAIGCSYKYLNGGPGAPAFVWMHPRHQGRTVQPLTGWLGHAAPFEFSGDYRPAAGIQQFQCGTPPVLALSALEASLDVFDAAQQLGGMAALRKKSLALTESFIAEIDARVPGASIESPRDPTLRGSQVSIALPSDIDGYAVMQALISRGVVGDFRAGSPGLLRFGFTPLYTRFIDVVDAVTVLVDVLSTKAWNTPRFTKRSAVT